MTTRTTAATMIHRRPRWLDRPWTPGACHSECARQQPRGCRGRAGIDTPGGPAGAVCPVGNVLARPAWAPFSPLSSQSGHGDLAGRRHGHPLDRRRLTGRRRPGAEREGGHDVVAGQSLDPLALPLPECRPDVLGHDRLLGPVESLATRPVAGAAGRRPTRRARGRWPPGASSVGRALVGPDQRGAGVRSLLEERERGGGEGVDLLGLVGQQVGRPGGSLGPQPVEQVVLVSWSARLSRRDERGD